jgi:hypothetical protein
VSLRGGAALRVVVSSAATQCIGLVRGAAVEVEREGFPGIWMRTSPHLACACYHCVMHALRCLLGRMNLGTIAGSLLSCQLTCTLHEGHAHAACVQNQH